MKGPLEAHRPPPLTDAQVLSIARKVQAVRHAGPSASRRVAPKLLVATLALAVAGLVLVLQWRTPTPITASTGAPLPPVIEGTFAFSDGSTVSLADEARVEVVANQAGKLTLLLRGGRGRFEVNPESHRQWVIEAGLASVEVVGTIFTVTRTDEDVHVAVERGVVLVRSDTFRDRVQRLEAGQQATARAPPPPAPASLPEPLEAPSTLHPAPIAVPLARPEPQRSTTSTPDWRPAARAGEFPAAWGLLGADFERALETDDVGDLELMADVARAVGRPTEAARALRRALEVDPGQPTIAFTLARLEVELGRPADAAMHFAVVAAAQPPSPLRYDALVRRVEVLMATGERGAAQACAKEALHDFPFGAHTATLTQLVNELESPNP